MNRLAITTSACAVAIVAALFLFPSTASADSDVVAPKLANPDGWTGRAISLTAKAGKKLSMIVGFKGNTAPAVGDKAVAASKDGTLAECTVEIVRVTKRRAYAVSSCTMEQAKRHNYIYEAL